MLTRRNFIESAAVISGAALSGVALADRAISAPPARLNHLIYNVRFAHAQQFAAHLIAQGIRGAGIGESDLGSVWFGQLRASCIQGARCLSKPGSIKQGIVGMGTHTDFLVMQSLARDIGFNTRFHAEHRRTQGTWHHQVKHNDWVASDFESLAQPRWAQTLAGVLSNHELSRSQSLAEQTHVMNVHEPRMLVSWVLG